MCPFMLYLNDSLFIQISTIIYKFQQYIKESDCICLSHYSEYQSNHPLFIAKRTHSI